MPKVKTAISVPSPLFKEAEALARKLGVSRSRLYSKALEDFVGHHENQELLEKINAAYAEGFDAEEKRLFTRMKGYQRALIEEKK